MTRTAWVAGALGGIGSACVRSLSASGFRVHASDRPDEDVTLPGVAEDVAARLHAESGPIDVAVHAVGMSGRRLGDGPVSACTDDGWSEVMRVDLTSAFYFLRSCMNHSESGASIVLIGSALAQTLDEDFLTVAYRVAKAGLVSMVEAAAYEASRRQIRVNVVAPGLVDTTMSRRAITDERIASRFPTLMPLSRRPSTADEVAASVTWLASDGSSQTTGAVIPVDGGWQLR